MRIVKMSLAAAVAVAGLSTASLAEMKVNGSADFRWLYQSNAGYKKDASSNKHSRMRFDLELKAPSEDGKGMVHVRLRTDNNAGEANAVTADKAYITYKVNKDITIGGGPRISFPGNYSYTKVPGMTVKAKVAGFTIGAGFADKETGSEDMEKQIITAKGKVGPSTIKFDYKLGKGNYDKKNKTGEYIAFGANTKVAGASINVAYAAGMGDDTENKDVSIMGVDVDVKAGPVNAIAAFSISGKKGGNVTELGAAGEAELAMGDIKNSQGLETTAMLFGAKAKVSGVALKGYYSMATVKDADDTSTRIYVDAKYQFNTQSNATLMYYIDSKGIDDVEDQTSIEIRLASKF